MSNSEMKTDKSTAEQDNSRRDFIVGSALAAGAATIGVGSSAHAQDSRLSDVVKGGRVMTASFDARYREKLTREDLFQVVEQMLEIAGCPTCGLSGIDFRLGLDPIFEVKSVVPVNVGVEQF